MARQVSSNRLRGLPKARPGTNNAWLKLADLKLKRVARVIPLWIYEMGSAFGITGSFAQSVGKRDFYPRNFNQPSWAFKGQTHNEKEYAQIAEFVRDGQLSALGGNQLFIIDVPGAGISARRNMKGRHSGTKLQGYVRDIRRRHERWVNAPEYQFEFVVSRHLAGPIRDVYTPPHVLKDWSGLYLGGNYLDDPDQAYLDAEDQVNRPTESGGD